MSTSDSQRMVVLSDASPLIFLAKLDRLGLIKRLIPGRHVILECVVKEVLSHRSNPIEFERLRAWVNSVEVVQYEEKIFPTSALSVSDQSTLAWALNNNAEWLIADERLLRKFARDRGVQVIGFCGLLVKAAKKGLISQKESREMLDVAIDQHGLRISIRLYRKILSDLGF